eukprot:GFUD01009245.1.p1 GENE.GFUD01009245.1~~GFUD01009245.1.p1  ORF type:complete len:147 (-),score=26.19 GFUD01009245.1:357-797(-)
MAWIGQELERRTELIMAWLEELVRLALACYKHSAQFSPLGKEDSVLLSGGHSINLGGRPENVLLPGGHKYFKKWLPTSPFFERGKIGKLPQKWKILEKCGKNHENVLLLGGHKYFKKWLPTSPFFEKFRYRDISQLFPDFHDGLLL